MDLTDSLAHEERNTLRRCPIGRLLVSLPEEQAAALTARLATSPDDERYLSNSAILRALNRAGIRSSKESVAEHRAGRCRCLD